MKLLSLSLVPFVLLLLSSDNQANQDGENPEGKISYIITSGDQIRVEKNELVKSLRSARADFTVSTSNAKQTLQGFGGAFNEHGWVTLCKLNTSERQKVLTAIFSTNEANLSYGRIPIGASDYALERYTLAPVKDDFEMKNFTLERDHLYLIPYIKAAQTIRPDIKLWGSAWSPPVWMKDNNDYEAGNFIDDPKYYKAYALYLAKFAEEYEKLGMPITSVAVQNEPAAVTGYPNGGWKPAQFSTFIRDHMGPVFTERNVSARIMLGTFNEDKYSTYLKTVLDDAEAKKYVGIIGLQWNGDKQIEDLLASHPGIPIMQTETDCGNWFWLPGFNPNHAANDFNYAAYTWMRMKSYFSKGAESYMLWNIILDQDGKNIDKRGGWPQNSAIVIDTNTKKVTYTPMFRAFEHFTRYLPAGSKYVDTKGSYESVIAFTTPQDNIVVELLNEKSKNHIIKGHINGKFYSIEIPPKSFATLIIEI